MTLQEIKLAGLAIGLQFHEHEKFLLLPFVASDCLWNPVEKDDQAMHLFKSYPRECIKLFCKKLMDSDFIQVNETIIEAVAGTVGVYA